MGFANGREVTGTTDTPTVGTDDGGLIRCTNAAEVTVTLNNTGWTAGESAFLLASEGAGGIAFAVSGVTISSVAGSSPTVVSGGLALCTYSATNVWTVSGELGGDVDLGGSPLVNAGPIEHATETASVSGSKAIDVSTYAYGKYTMTADTTFSFSNPAPSGDLTVFVMRLIGNYSPTFPGSVDWPSGAAPTYSDPAMFTFSTDDGGTIWYGAMRGGGFA